MESLSISPSRFAPYQVIAQDQNIHFVRKKLSQASSGRQTTGSFLLNDIFNTIGTPVSRKNDSITA